MIDIMSTPFAAVAAGAMDLCDAPANSRVKNLDIPLQGLVTRRTSCCTVSPASSFVAVVFNTLFLEPTEDGITDWDHKSHELLLQVFGNRTAYQAHGGRSKVPAGTGQENHGSSNASVQLSLAKAPTLAANCGRHPIDKRPGEDRSDGEDNGRRKHARVGKGKSYGPKIKVVCPYKLRYPNNSEFEGCRSHEWGRLVEHLVRRTHRPVDLCQRCGKDFFDDGEWEQHTTACDEVSTQVFETPICVGRDKVAAIKQLTTKGRSNRPTEDLYRELWTILFGSDPPIPACAVWLRVVGSSGLQDPDSTPAPPQEEPVLPHSAGGQLEYISSPLHPWHRGDLPPSGSPQAVSNLEHAFQYVNPEQLQNTETQPPQLPVMFNDSPKSPMYTTFASLPSNSTGPTSSEATELESLLLPCPPDWSFLNGQVPDGLSELEQDHAEALDDEYFEGNI